MHLPRESAAPQVRIRYGRYVVRRLRQAGHAALADSLAKATAALKAAARATEDAVENVEDALADRDAADEALDLAAQEARNHLAGRGLRAADEAPYTDLFPNGIAYYTAASLDEEERRYKELRDRAEKHLPKTDAVRRSLVAAIDKGLKAWREGVVAVDEARNAVSAASTGLARATDAWERQVEKTYGALVQTLGRAGAASYFPRSRGATKAQTPKPDLPPTN